MIEIFPRNKLHESGYKMMKVLLDEKEISNVSDVVTIKIGKLSYLRIDVTEDGWFRIWVDGKKKIKNVGLFNISCADFELVRRSKNGSK